MVGLEPLSVSHQPRPDVVIIQEVIEDLEMLGEEAVCLIHGGVDHTSACQGGHGGHVRVLTIAPLQLQLTMLANGGANAVNGHHIQVLCPLHSPLLYKQLLVEVVVVEAHKHADVAHDLQDVQALVQAAHGQMIVLQLQSILVSGQGSHFTVGFPVMQCHGCEVIEASFHVMHYLLRDHAALASGRVSVKRRRKQRQWHRGASALTSLMLMSLRNTRSGAMCKKVPLGCHSENQQ